MKIKIDFITNSSSTNYIVCLPESYTISKEQYLELMDHIWDSDEFYDEEKEDLYNAYDFVMEAIDTIQNGGAVYSEEDELVFRICTYLVDVFHITYVDSGPGGDMIVGVSQKSLNDIFYKVNEESLNFNNIMKKGSKI